MECVKMKEYKHNERDIYKAVGIKKDVLDRKMHNAKYYALKLYKRHGDRVSIHVETFEKMLTKRELAMLYVFSVIENQELIMSAYKTDNLMYA